MRGRTGEGWIQVRGRVVTSYLLHDGAGVYLIDGGFIGGIGRIARALDALGKSWEDVRAILLTHGHLDHTLNVERLRELTGAKVYAPARDREIVAGRFGYRGITRFCGIAEWTGRALLRYRAPEIEEWFDFGEELAFWGGLRAVGLPGHTPGHTGFYSPSRRLLFCGDIFANFMGPPRMSPPWFTVDSAEAKQSLHRAADLELDGVLPNHCGSGRPEDHLRDLRRLCERHQVSRL